MLLYIIRHGDPHYPTDSLTERGVLQAEAVGKRLAAAGIHKVFSSPMGRAKQTAEPTCRLLGLECNIEEWAYELDRGEMYLEIPDGRMKPLGELQGTYLMENGGYDYRFSDSCQHPILKTHTGMDKAVARVRAGSRDFLERMGYREENGVYRILRPSEEKVALFCHAGLGKALVAELLHVPVANMFASFSYNHTGVTILQFKNNENGITSPKCLCYSDCSHLYAHGPDLRYINKIDI